MAGLSRGEAVLGMLACFAMVLQCTLATTYTVGGSSNWTIPAAAGNSQLYTSWITGKTFKVGDELVFNFISGEHDVVRVTKTNYDSCGKTSPLETYTTPPVKITLNTSETHYYICSIGAHCQNGQKVTITMAASSPTSSPSPSPSSSTSSPPPSGSPSSTPEAPSTPNAATPSEGSAPSNGPSSSTTPSPTNNDNSSASRLTASVGIFSGVAALFLL